jgi:hypothetical protein
MLAASKEYLRMVERHTEYMDYKEYWRLMSVLSKFLQGSFQNDAVVDQMVQINDKIADRIAARPVLEDHFNPFDVANIYQSLASKDWNLLVEKHRGVKSMLERFKTTNGLAYQRFLSDNPSRRPNRGLEFASSKESLDGIPSDLSSGCALILRRDLLSTVERVHSVNMVFQLVDFKYRELHVETGLTKNEVDVLLLHLSRNLQIEPELVSYFDNGQVSFAKLKDRLQGFVFTDPLRKEMNLHKTLLSCKQN